MCLYVNYCWIGWSDDGVLCFVIDVGEVDVCVNVIVLVMGGGSWL